MYRCRSLLVPVLAALALVAAGLAAGCSSDPPASRWQEVTSGRFTGEETVQQDLGTFYLVGQVRLAWDLSGPSDARAEFRLLVSRSTDANTTESNGSSVRSWKENFALQSDEAFVIGVPEPDEYHVTLTQRLPRGVSVGYTGTFTLYTRDLD